MNFTTTTTLSLDAPIDLLVLGAFEDQALEGRVGEVDIKLGGALADAIGLARVERERADERTTGIAHDATGDIQNPRFGAGAQQCAERSVLLLEAAGHRLPLAQALVLFAQPFVLGVHEQQLGDLLTGGIECLGRAGDYVEHRQIGRAHV